MMKTCIAAQCSQAHLPVYWSLAQATSLTAFPAITPFSFKLRI